MKPLYPLMPAGGIYTTAGDLFRFHKALIENRLISQKSQQEAYTNYKDGYGYGWYIRESPKGKQIGHKGGIMGFCSMFTREVNDNSCIIAFSNDYSCSERPETDLNAIDISFLQIFEGTYTIYYIPRVAIKSNPATLPQFTGTYKMDSTVGFIIDVTVKDDHLQAVLTMGIHMHFMKKRKTSFSQNKVMRSWSLNATLVVK